MNTRDLGDKLEKDLENLLGMRRTAKSGAHWDNADLSSRSLLIEAKVKNTAKWLQPSRAEIIKLIKQAKAVGKEWAYVQRNSAGDFVVLDLNFFAELIEAWKNENQNNSTS